MRPKANEAVSEGHITYRNTARERPRSESSSEARIRELRKSEWTEQKAKVRSDFRGELVSEGHIECRNTSCWYRLSSRRDLRAELARRETLLTLAKRVRFLVLARHLIRLCRFLDSVEFIAPLIIASLITAALGLSLRSFARCARELRCFSSLELRWLGTSYSST